MGNETLRSIIALSVAGVWVLAGVASVVTQNYKTLEVTTPVMMIVTGFLFGYQIQVKKATAKKEEGGA